MYKRILRNHSINPIEKEKKFSIESEHRIRKGNKMMYRKAKGKIT
jgi:hypothetical protein